jgi:hypothetical protein
MDMDPISQMFSVGRAFSEKIEVLPGVRIIFRSLSPREQMLVDEEVEKFTNADSRFLSLQVQTLARAIYIINDGMTLSASTEECARLKESLKREPDRVDQAYFNLSTKVERPVIEAMYLSYTEFYNKLYENLENLKKNLNRPPSGDGTSTSANTSASSPPTNDSSPST